MKKAMSLLTATAMAATLLAGCGGGTASSSAAPAADSTSTEASSTAAEPAADAAAEEGKVLNIWCWNDEFQSRFNDYYPGVKEIAADKSTTTLNNGVTVKWTINPNDNNNYQNKLDEALLKQDSAVADDKIDIFLIEADYALKYVDSEYTLDVKKDVGLTDDDLKDQYQYTKDIVTVDGVQKGTTWQATPGLFAYRRSIAEDVLGTDDPTEVQAALSDWDKFNDVAEKAAAKGYKMLSGYDDSYRTFPNNVSAGWVDGTTVKVDPNIMNWVDQTKTYTWKFGVFKYELKDGNETARPDAKFVLYKNEEGKKLYAQADENDKITGWTDDKTKATGFISPADGKFTISGLDSDTYYLEEIEAPAGYNVLKEPVVVTINNEGKVNVSEENPHGIDEVKVLNQTGAELPSTGGAGTTVFYAVGSALVLAAVVLLVTRKRMSAKN